MKHYTFDGQKVTHSIHEPDPPLGYWVYSPEYLHCNWYQVGGTRRNKLWAERYKDEVPKEFLAHLLILGVPIHG